MNKIVPHLYGRYPSRKVPTADLMLRTKCVRRTLFLVWTQKMVTLQNMTNRRSADLFPKVTYPLQIPSFNFSKL